MCVDGLERDKRQFQIDIESEIMIGTWKFKEFIDRN